MNVDFLSKQCYRIAFIGRTSSGKTCILASLGLGRSSNARLTSSFRPLDFPPLTDDEKQRLDTDKDVRLRMNFEIGEQSLNEAMTKLKVGKRPAATERTADVRPMLEFQLGDAEGRGDFYIWTEDYPGEYLNIEDLKTENSEAHVLKQRLLQYDGLILVVDTAVTKEQKKSVGVDIEALSSFFAYLAEEMKSGKARLSQIPIVIALSKWDRYSKTIQFNSPEEERKKLEAYLRQNPMYDSLIKTIRSNAQQQETEPTGDLMAGIAYGNTAVFPVSAFGKFIDDPVEGECPDSSSQTSYGIVEPFFWLACRSDDLKIDKLEKDYNSLWKWRPGKVAPVRNEAVRFSNRINGATDTKKRYSALIGKCNHVYGLLTLFWFSFVILLILLGYDEYWSYRVSRWESVIGAPTTTISQLSDMRQKLDSYKALYYKGLFFAPSSKRIDGDIDSVDIHIDDLLWDPVKNTKELSKKAELAQKYIDALQSGAHSNEALKIINDYRVFKEEESWKTVASVKILADRAKRAEQYLTDYNGDGTAIHAVEATDIIEQYKKSIEEDVWKLVKDAVPDSENQLNLAEEYRDKYPDGEHTVQAKEIIDRIRNKRIWDTALVHYTEVKAVESIPRMLGELQDLISRFGLTQERCLPLVSEVPQMIDSKLNSLPESTPVFEKIAKCDEALTALKTFENELRNSDANSLADLIVKSHESVEAFRSGQIEMYDRNLYEKVRNSKNKNACDSYQSSMKPFGGGSMASYVSAYQDYLESKDKVQDNVIVVCNLYWGPQTTENTIIKSELHISNKSLNSDIRSYAADTRELGHTTLNGVKPKDKIRISVSSKSKGNWWHANKREYGGGEESFYLYELVEPSGRSIRLKDDFNGTFNARLDVTATAPNMKPEPKLPTWTKKK